MLIISFDAIGDDEFDELKKYPAVASFIRKASVHRDVSSIFVSNTYPVHTSVATGVTPDKHGISSNTEPFPSRNQKWVTCEKSIRSKTIWQAAKDKGMKTAAVLWPVTSYSKSLDYNIPEEHISPGRSQVVANLRAGSAMLQLKMFLKYHKLIAGTDEPHLSNFSAACMADILRNNKPDLALVHLITYDSFCHKYGRGESKLKEAYEALDRNLALLLDAAGDNRDIIIFSDHSQINVHTAITPNQILVETGLLSYDKDEYNIGESGCFIECCGGSAFFHAGVLSSDKISEVRGKISLTEGFNRFLTADELSVSGYHHAAFGFSAKSGYCFEGHPSSHKATHGYPLDMPDYKVFYMVRGDGFTPGTAYGGSLLEIAPLVAKRLGLKWEG